MNQYKLPKKIILTIFSLLLLVSCTKKKENTLIVGMELAYPPFETKDEIGNPIGVSVDLAYALGEFLNKDIIIENIAWSGLIPSLQTGKIDLIISSLTITEDRKKQIIFSDPYAQNSMAMLVSKESSIDSLETLNQLGRIVAVKQGTTPFLFAHKYLTNTTINSFTSESAAVIEVIQEKADAILYDQLTIYNNYQRNIDSTKMIGIELKKEDISLWGIGINKNNTKLQSDVNEFLKEFKEKKGFSPIINKYLSTEKEIFEQNNFDFFF